jgi:hypothetical protein
MVAAKFTAIGFATTTPIDNRKRTDVLVDGLKKFSQQIDLADLIGMDPATSLAMGSVPYEIRRKNGEVLARGTTNQLGDTERVFTRNPEELVLYVGDGTWTLGADCRHAIEGDN